MKGLISPLKIFQQFHGGEKGKKEALSQLKILIEKVDDLKLRVAAIKYYGKIGGSQGDFDFLENIIISDSKPLVRNEALKVLFSHFSHDALDPLSWLLEHERSPLILSTLRFTLENSRYSLLQSLRDDMDTCLRNLTPIFGVSLEETKFFLDVEAILEREGGDHALGRSTVHFYEILRGEQGGLSWIKIEDGRVTSLKLNYFQWEYVRQNLDIIKSLLSLKDVSLFLSLLEKHSLRGAFSFELPGSIRLLTHLRTLDLSRGHLKEFPGELRALPRLTTLILNHNEITVLPPWIRTLTSLMLLDLRHNPLQELSAEQISFLGTLTLKR